ncbi:DUF488 domain-containing protein [Treponema denticola]|uniref:DUF488 domain-containing protein n=1 Tax=Treponema denticola TaxID=158 RepID=UPI002104F491|nr:DUF488 domain-containing protein [Treponema denticola]
MITNMKAKIYTIGFTKKDAKTFFSLLSKNKIVRLIDIRLNNFSQLAGFTKKSDLQYFLKKICNIEYLHLSELAPTEDILRRYKRGAIGWVEYEQQFNALLQKRKPENSMGLDILMDSCLLCSEPTADKCHRRLVAEYFKKLYPNIEIIHI